MIDTIRNGTPATIPAWFRTQEIELELGVYCEAAVYTGEYGRQRIYPDLSPKATPTRREAALPAPHTQAAAPPPAGNSKKIPLSKTGKGACISPALYGIMWY